MVQVIQLKRRIPGTGKPASGTGTGQVTAGELATAISATGATGVANLYIGDGTYVHDLVTAARQVEVAGDQSIAGNKTFTGEIIAAPAVLRLSGGTNGQVLSTDGGSGLSWLTLPEGLVTTFSATEGYVVGDFVIHNGHMYRANAANGPGGWDDDDWDRITTVDDLDSYLLRQSGTATPTGSRAGDVWFDTNVTPHQFKVYDGAAWISVAANYLPLGGGTLSGNLTFSGANATITGTTGLNLVGAVNTPIHVTTTGTGDITFSTAAAQNVLLPHDPTVNLGAATKQYVDAQVLAGSAIAPFFATETYAVGDFVVHNGQLWRAHTANGPAAWNATNWHQIATLDDLDDYLPLTGGTLSGDLTFSGANATITGTTGITLSAPAGQNVLLPRDPTVNLGAATKQYVDAHSPAQRFSATATYAVGDFIYHNGNLYRANSAVTAGPFDGDDWDRVATVADLPIIEAGPTAPTAPNTTGDLWYNTTTNQLMIFNGTTFEMVAGVWIQAAAPTGQPEGALWLNSTTHVLSVFDGTAWQGATGNRGSFGATGHANPVPGDVWYSTTGPQYWNGTAWTAVTLPGFAGVATTAPITGNGNTGSELGVTMATTAQIDAGTDAIYPINSAGLRNQVIGGANGVASLTTTNKLVVPAINELHTSVTALTGALRFVGNYDAAVSHVTTAATGTLTVGQNIPTAAAINEGWYVIVINEGTPTAPAPGVLMHAGDWIVSTGSQWIHVPLYHAAVTAANVAITTINAQTWTNAQAALAGIYGLLTTAGTAAVVSDGVSISGDGTTADPLEVIHINGGTY